MYQLSGSNPLMEMKIEATIVLWFRAYRGKGTESSILCQNAGLDYEHSSAGKHGCPDLDTVGTDPQASVLALILEHRLKRLREHLL